MTFVAAPTRFDPGPSGAVAPGSAPARHVRIAGPRPLFGSRFPRAGAPALATILVAVALLAGARPAAAQGLDAGFNSAGIIDYPTALDQSTANMVHGTAEIADLSTPDLRLANLRYGRQLGNLQLLADLYDQTEPTREFGYGEAKAKLRLVNLDALHTYIAVGALARWTDQSSKQAELLDNRPYSLLAVLTTELFPFDQWGAFLVNFYVDNRIADAGLKVQIYEGIRFVAESDYHYGDINGDSNKWRFKAGLEFEGERSFYAQLFYDDSGKHARLQIGTGF